MEALIFDSHAHYDDSAFDSDREELLALLPQKGVCHVINAGASLKGSAASIALAEKYPYFHAAAGVHPEDAGNLPADWIEQLGRFLDHPKVVAVGEIGLDYHYEDACPREVQQQVFEAQLRLARERDLPVIVHDREAHGDTMALLRKYRPRGVVHCFSGSAEMAREVVALGMYVGLGGVVTFKNAKHPLEVAAAVPLERILNETDAPYMAPVPCRGKRCDSTMIPWSAAKIGEIKGVSAQEVLAQGCRNAAALFGIAL